MQPELRESYTFEPHISDTELMEHVNDIILQVSSGAPDSTVVVSIFEWKGLTPWQP